jgi:D-sedoheptulose 7-phosphate isomerase
MGFEAAIKKQIEQGIELRRYLEGESVLLAAIAGEMVRAFKKGGKLIVFGNGGSAADAQHIAGELSGRLYRERAPLPAISLAANTSSLTAIANDYDYSKVFSRQLRGLIAKGDIALGISTSGNSPNVLLAMEEAKKGGAVCIAFSGRGGKLKEISDYCLSVPSNDTPRIQEAHITAAHIVCYLVEEMLFGDAHE